MAGKKGEGVGENEEEEGGETGGWKKWMW